MITIDIRPVSKVTDARQLEDIQRLTWGMDELELLHGRFLHALKYSGACLLGAYDGNKVVGFVFGLLGTVEDLDNRVDQVAAARLQMYSVIMGVLPEYQGQGIGYRLKLAQREFVFRIGVRLVTWTYDPLESRNAHFNIGKLGVVCHRYVRNFHGDLGGINVGLPTDRFFVDWWVTSNRVVDRLSSKRGSLNLEAFQSGGAEVVNKASLDHNNLLVPPQEFIHSNSRMLLVEIPADIQLYKRRDMALAIEWREHTRQLFEHYFSENYLISDFVRHIDEKGVKRSYYFLILGDA